MSALDQSYACIPRTHFLARKLNCIHILSKTRRFSQERASSKRQVSIKTVPAVLSRVPNVRPLGSTVLFLWNSFQACGIHAKKHCEHWLLFTQYRDEFSAPQIESLIISNSSFSAPISNFAFQNELFNQTFIFSYPLDGFNGNLHVFDTS